MATRSIYVLVCLYVSACVSTFTTAMHLCYLLVYDGYIGYKGMFVQYMYTVCLHKYACVCTVIIQYAQTFLIVV